MKLGFVAGMLWNGRQHSALDGTKLLLVRYVDPTLAPIDEYAVCVDAAGAGTGEWVLTVSGSSARMTPQSAQAAADHTIVGIVDQIDISSQSSE